MGNDAVVVTDIYKFYGMLHDKVPITGTTGDGKPVQPETRLQKPSYKVWLRDIALKKAMMF